MTRWILEICSLRHHFDVTLDISSRWHFILIDSVGLLLVLLNNILLVHHVFIWVRLGRHSFFRLFILILLLLIYIEWLGLNSIMLLVISRLIFRLLGHCLLNHILLVLRSRFGSKGLLVLFILFIFSLMILSYCNLSLETLFLRILSWLLLNI